MYFLYFILGIFVFIIIMRIWMLFGGILKQGKTIPPINNTLGKKIQSGDKVLVYFYTPMCGACQTTTPIFNRLVKEFDNVFKVDLSKQPELGPAFSVVATPTIVLVENSKIKKFTIGAKSETYIKKLLS